MTNFFLRCYSLARSSGPNWQIPFNFSHIPSSRRFQRSADQIVLFFQAARKLLSICHRIYLPHRSTALPSWWPTRCTLMFQLINLIPEARRSGSSAKNVSESIFCLARLSIHYQFVTLGTLRASLLSRVLGKKGSSFEIIKCHSGSYGHFLSHNKYQIL